MLEKSYEIGGKKFVQKKLVLGQIRQLVGVIEGVTLDTSADIAGIIDALADRLPAAFAVVLTPEGTDPRNKDLAALADEIEFNIEAEQVFEVIDDFFDCNPILSLLERFQGMIGKIKGKFGTAKTGLTNSSVSSPEETLSTGIPSSGDAQPTIAAPT